MVGRPLRAPASCLKVKKNKTNKQKQINNEKYTGHACMHGYSPVSVHVAKKRREQRNSSKGSPTVGICHHEERFVRLKAYNSYLLVKELNSIEHN